MGDVLSAPDFGAFTLSPDGRFLAAGRIDYLRTVSGRFSRLLVLALDEGKADAPAPETLVFTGDCDAWSPEFADDSTALVFLTDHAGEARPWIAAERDAVPAPAAGVERMALAPKWRPGAPSREAGRGFAFLSFATRAEQGFADPLVWGDIPAAGFRHLYLVDEPGAAPQKLTTGPEDVYDFAWSPDGEHLAVLVAPSFEMERHLENEVRIVRAADGAVVRRLGTERGLNAFLSWSPSGRHLAWIAHGADGRVGKPELFSLRLDDGAIQRASHDVPGYVARYDWLPDGAGLVFPAAEGVTSVIYAALVEGDAFAPARAILRPAGYVGGLAVARRRARMALRIEGPRTPPCLVVADFERRGEALVLAPLHAVTPRSARKEARIPGDATVFCARAPDGHPVDTIVLAPRRAPPAPRPLCVWLHGGPNEYCALSYQPWWQLFVARGHVVLAPNFRGSGSYAEARVRANVGDLGGGDADDVIAAIDEAAAGGGVDLSRITLFGWSYGAYLAFHVALKLLRRDPARGRVGRVVAGGGVYDWLSHYGQAELRFPWRDYLGGSPLLDAREADARSPVRHAREIGERLGGGEILLVHGLSDGRASVMQARMMHRALVEAGARSTLVVYPREAHVLVEPEHIRDLLERATAPLIR